MHAHPLTYSITAKLTKEEYDAVLSRARHARQTLSAYLRRIVLESVHVSPAYRRMLELEAAQIESLRLTFLAIQHGKARSQTDIEREAFSHASGIVDRYLSTSRAASSGADDITPDTAQPRVNGVTGL
jgi:hypothetical protein